MTKTRTVRKRLREGRPLWADSPRIHPPYRKKPHVLNCDVVIVGAGITGAIAALLLSEDGHKVMVLDRRPPVTGSTLASTAMINFEIDEPLSALAGKIGPAKARRAYKRSYLSVRHLHRLVDDYGIACGWMPGSSLYLAGDAMGHRALEAEVKMRKRVKLPSHYIDEKRLKTRYGFERRGAILSHGVASANPAQLTAGILRAAEKLGAHIYSPQDVRDVVDGRNSVSVRTTEGLAIVARKAIFATGYEVLKQIPKGKYEIVSTWALATQTLKTSDLWPTQCQVWEASDPYLYMRVTPDHRIVAGGEDAAFISAGRREAATKSRTRTILRKLEKLLPGRALRADYAWSGSFAISPTGLPYINGVKGMKNCFAVLGCGGNGITYAMVAAEIARAWVRGKKDPDQDLFR